MIGGVAMHSIFGFDILIIRVHFLHHQKNSLPNIYYIENMHTLHKLWQ